MTLLLLLIVVIGAAALAVDWRLGKAARRNHRRLAKKAREWRNNRED